MAHDEQSLAAVAANSAVASRARVHELLGRNDVKVSCVCPLCFVCACLRLLALHCFVYFHPHKNHLSARYNGPAEECHQVTQKTKLRFTWHLVAEGLNETCNVQLTCQKTVQRGVHLPKAWKSKWRLGGEVLPIDAWAHEAVQRARDEFSLSDGVKLDCRFSFLTKQTRTHTCTHLFYVHHHRYAGDPGFVPTQRSNLAYRWAIAVGGAIHEADVHVRADHAAERGIPLPEGWRVTLSASDLGSRAAEAGRALEAGDGVSELECRLAGVPKACIAGSKGELFPGTIVPLRTPSSGQMNFVLCAHVSGNAWYCHAGSFEASDPGAPVRGLLDEAGLVLKDIVEEGCGEERPAKRIRIRQHAFSSQLQSLVDSSPDDWRTLVAIATLKAEQERSRRNEHFPDWSAALAGFEPNPWKWEVVEGRASQVRVYFLWKWHDAGSATRSWSFELTCQQLHNLLARGDVPTPGGLQLSDRTLWARLVEYAQEQSRRLLWPCRYLGVPMGGGKHQPDPALWDTATTESKSAMIVCFEWEHLTVGPRKKRHVVSISVNHALHNHRPPPRWPLRSRNEWLHFTVDGLNAFAELKKNGTSYHGVSYENVERPEIMPGLPKGGVDIQDVPLFWNFPSGRCDSYTMLQLRSLPGDEFLSSDADADEAYLEMAKQFRFDVLGQVAGDEPDKCLAEFREDMGTLHDERWKSLTWRRPDKESSPSWWLINPCDEDRTQPPKLLSRSLACLRLELQQQRVATTSKVKREREVRTEQNAHAVDVIHSNEQIWKLVGGPPPEALLAPSAEALAAVSETCKHLQKLVEANKDSHDGLSVFGEELLRAARSLSSLEWRVIRDERFHVTPEGLFDEFVKNVEAIARRSHGEAKRRQEWLAERNDEAEGGEGEDDDAEKAVRTPGARIDEYGCNLDRFVPLGGRRPVGWKQAVSIAGWVQIDEMRTLLELHYDQLHLEKYLALGKSGNKRRTSDYKVFSSIAQAHRLKLCQRISLPDSIKQIFRCPSHEDKWEKLEEARLAIARLIQGERDIEIECAQDAEEIAEALRRSSSVYPDALAGHDRFPDGSRVLAESPPSDLSIADQRAMICTAISKSGVGSTISIRTRPLTSNPPIDKFAKAIVDPAHTVKVIAATKKIEAPSQEAMLDKLLLVLFDALFLDASLTWTARNVSNLHCSETLPIAKYFLKGLAIGDAPLFTGMCAFCARLLPDKAVGSAWKFGPPIDRHGQPAALDERGSPDLRAQPPCLLRYSPSLFAKESPAVFQYDEATNRLTIKPGQTPPWLRQSEHLPPGESNIWLYCEDGVFAFVVVIGLCKATGATAHTITYSNRHDAS